MKCFNSGKPNLSANEVIANKRARTIYKHNVDQNKNAKTSNHDGTILYENNMVKQARNYEKLADMNKGYYLCNDCSGVQTRESAPKSMANSISTKMDMTGITVGEMKATNYEFKIDQVDTSGGYAVRNYLGVYEPIGLNDNRFSYKLKSSTESYLFFFDDGLEAQWWFNSKLGRITDAKIKSIEASAANTPDKIDGVTPWKIQRTELDVGVGAETYVDLSGARVVPVLDTIRMEVDPNNKLYNTQYPPMNLLEHVTVSGVDLSGNTTSDNYLQYFSNSNKIILG